MSGSRRRLAWLVAPALMLCRAGLAPAAEFWSPDIESRFRSLCSDAPRSFAGVALDGYALRCRHLDTNRAWYRARYLEGSYARIGEAVRREAGAVKTVFYPFGGPDLPTPFTVFPDADRVTAVALESVGSPADFAASADEKSFVFPERAEGTMRPSSVRATLAALVSFYATGYWTVDDPFPSMPVSHVVLLQAIHDLGGTIDSARAVRIGDEGRVEPSAAGAPGIEVAFHTGDGRHRVYRYVTANLDDDHFARGSGLAKLIRAEHPDGVLIKAGTNLIGEAAFSNVRALVLELPRAIVEDGELAGEDHRDVPGFRHVSVPLGGLGIGYAQHAEENAADLWVRSSPASAPSQAAPR